MIRALLLFLILAPPAAAEMVVATTTVRAQTVLTPGHVKLATGEAIGAVTDPAEVVGKEARVTLYAGRPVRAADLGPPAIVERNQVVPLIFDNGALTIRAEGRALDRAGIGDRVRVMNLGSRINVFGQVREDGTVLVSE